MSRFNTLSDWLNWLEQLHPTEIDLGLQRVYSVADRLNLLKPPTSVSHKYSGELNVSSVASEKFNQPDFINKVTVITIAGTNGKGSCISVLEKCLLEQGQHVASYTSPHLHHFCERIRIDGQMVDEDLVCEAFAAIDGVRGDTSLTYFEFGTLAALWIFALKRIPYVLLEVGLGGRLDAVNIVDADLAIITSIDVDHQAWLGNDRNIISQEKLGVARPTRPLIIAETNLTPNLRLAGEKYPALVVGRDYWVNTNANDGQHNEWEFQWDGKAISLPLPRLPLPSVAAAILALKILGQCPEEQKLRNLMAAMVLPGRFEKATVDGVSVIYDVAHNPAAAIELVKRLERDSQEGPDNIAGKIFAVTAVMSDKDQCAMIEPLSSQIHHWYLGDLADIPRAASATVLADLLAEQHCSFTVKSTIGDAFQTALAAADSHDRIVVFGSFFTVGAIQAAVKMIDDKTVSQ